EELTWLYEFVSNRAGGLIVMDGRRGHLASYGDSPIGPLLPERLDQPTLRPDGLLLTAEGQSNATLRLEPDAQQNNQTWADLPAPTYVAPIKPRAGIDQVLVEVSVGREDDPPLPAVLTRRVGAGWVWYSAIDETWRWRRDVESLYQNRYWQQVTNRVVEPLYASEDKFVSLGVDDAVVESGSEIPVRVRLRDEDGKPRLTAEASVYLETEDGERIIRAALSPDAVEGGRFTAELDASVAPGIYRVGVEVDGVSESDLLAKTLVTILGTDSASGELADITLNRELLDTLAQMTGGQVLAEHESGKLPDLLEGLSSTTIQEQVSALWTGWPWFASVVGLLALEFGLRRRLGML
ncbi:MAG: Ig-like domain-containing protein, partial [Planctomycetota bacterium]